MRNLWWVLVVAALIWVGARSSANPYGALETAFNATGARPTGYSVTGWTKLPAGGRSASLPAIVRHMARSGRLAGPIRESDGIGYTRAELIATVGDTLTTVAAERLGSGATYASVLRTASAGFTNLSGSIAWLQGDLAGYGRPHLAVTLEGTRPGPVGPNAAAEIARGAFGAVGGTVTSSAAGGPLASFMGNTSQLRGGERIHGARVNLQVAVSDLSAGAGPTRVLVGSPLITVTY